MTHIIKYNYGRSDVRHEQTNNVLVTVKKNYKLFKRPNIYVRHCIITKTQKIIIRDPIYLEVDSQYITLFLAVQYITLRKEKLKL